MRMRRAMLAVTALCLNLVMLSTAALAVTPDEDFKKRSSRPGVVRSFGFDSQLQVRSYLEPPWKGVYRGQVDTTIKTSGA